MGKQKISSYARWHWETSFSHALPEKSRTLPPRLRLATHHPTHSHWSSGATTLHSTHIPSAGCRIRKSLHTASASGQQQYAPEPSLPASSDPPISGLDKVGIRQRLRSWTPEESADGDEAASLATTQSALDNAAMEYMQSDLQIKAEEGYDDDAVTEIFTQSFDRMSGEYEETDPGKAQFRPGDLVVLPGGRSGTANFGVYLKHTQEYDLVYSMGGRISVLQFSQLQYKCPSYFTQEELAPLLAYLPDDPFLEGLFVVKTYSECIPRNVGAHVLRKLEAFSGAVDEAFRMHAGALNKLHSLVAHPTQARYMLLAEIAAKVAGVPMSEAANLPEPLLFAVSYQCVRGSFGFKVTNRTYVHTRAVFVEAKHSVAVVGRVQKWVRAYQEEASSRIRNVRPSKQTRQEANHIHSFARKALQLIEASKEIRLYSPHGAVIGTKTEYLGNPRRAAALVEANFSDSDQDIIHFLALYVAGKAFMYNPQLVGLPAVIVRAVRGNDDFVAMQTEVDMDAAHTLLVEMGVMQPFVNPEAIDRELVLHDEQLQIELDKTQAAIDTGTSVEKAAGLNDSMKHMRRDWGSLPVYCIDSESTTEVDDGISIEEAVDRPGHIWIRAHAAHFSSHITPDHFLGRVAENRYQTQYLTEGKWPMVPEYLSNKFSIQANAPVITVSMCLDGDGKLVDYEVEAGIVRNVQTIHVNQVDEFFGHSRSQVKPLVMSIGNHVPEPLPSSETPGSSAAPTIAPEHQENLRRLLSYAQKIQNRRPRGALRTSNAHSAMSVRDQPRDPSLPAHYFQAAAYTMQPVPTAPSYALRFPSLSMTVYPGYDHNLLNPDTPPSSTLVGEHMTLANIVAAVYAAERDLPLVYYGTAPAAQGIQDQLPMMRQRLQRMARGEERMSRAFLRYTIASMALRKLSARPVKQVPMDVDCYIKITSPLRRYTDLASQWQLNAALKYEYETGKSLKVRSIPPGWYGGATNDASPTVDADGDTTNDALSATSGDLQQPTATNKPFIPPYSESDMNYLLARTHTHDLGQMRFVYSHNKHHVFQLFARALYTRPENIVPYYPKPTAVNPNPRPVRPGLDILNPAEGKFVAIMGKSGASRRTMIMEGLEITCSSEDGVGLEDKRLPAEGERWAVQVARVRLGQKRIDVRLLRRLGARGVE